MDAMMRYKVEADGQEFFFQTHLEAEKKCISLCKTHWSVRFSYYTGEKWLKVYLGGTFLKPGLTPPSMTKEEHTDKVYCEGVEYDVQPGY